MTNNKQSSNTKPKQYDLEDRTFEYAKKVREFVRKLPKTKTNFEDISQLVRSSGSVGANYIEANESLSKKDFIMRAKISRKEAKESRYWLKLVETDGSIIMENERNDLIQEASELTKIFSSIIEKSHNF